MADSHGSARQSSTARTALIALTTFALGTLAGHSLRTREGPPQVDVSIELTQELASLRTEIDSLRRVVEGGATNLAAPPVEPRREPASSSAELHAIVERLERAAVALENSGPTSTAQPHPSATGRSSISEIGGEIAARWREDSEGLAADLSRAHYLWTIDDVIARYGTPEYIPGVGGSELVYDLDGGGSGTTARTGSSWPKRYVQFRIVDGHVKEVIVEPE